MLQKQKLDGCRRGATINVNSQGHQETVGRVYRKRLCEKRERIFCLLRVTTTVFAPFLSFNWDTTRNGRERYACLRILDSAIRFYGMFRWLLLHLCRDLYDKNIDRK